jgi:hypothetical protein
MQLVKSVAFYTCAILFLRSIKNATAIKINNKTALDAYFINPAAKGK